MGVRFLLLTCVMLVLISVSAYAVSCADVSGYQTLVCGSTPDSASGLGAVDVCNICYPCGADDGVCPEDFYTSTSGQGSCRFCPDPDCLVSIDGNVEDIYGNNIVNATIFALYEPDIREVINYTDVSGYFQGSVRSGFIKLYVQYEDFDSKIIDVDLERSSTGLIATIDFTGTNAIEPGSCSSSCTDNFGDRCKASCDGINGCSYDAVTGPLGTVSSAFLCDDKVAGTRVFLPGSTDQYITCCQGTTVYSTSGERIGTSSQFTGKLKDSAAADDLITFTQRTRSAGERVTIQVAVWNSE